VKPYTKNYGKDGYTWTRGSWAVTEDYCLLESNCRLVKPAEDGVTKFLQNTGNVVTDYTATQFRRM